MDIENKLQELTEETLSFGEIISHSENPADIDFKDACHLFSQHLGYELDLISSDSHIQDIQPEVQMTNKQLCKLNELINPQQIDNYLTYDWNTKVTDFFSQLQTLKKIAA